jgi:hypothetical protein
VIEVLHLGGPSFLVANRPDIYPRGAAYVGGRSALFDLWFREGLIKPKSPENR